MNLMESNSSKHRKALITNWISVNDTGYLKSLRMSFVEAEDSTEVRYHTIHRAINLKLKRLYICESLEYPFDDSPRNVSDK